MHTPISHNIKKNCLINIVLSLTCAAKTALTRQGMESTRHLKVYCGVWHQDISSQYLSPINCKEGLSVSN